MEEGEAGVKLRGAIVQMGRMPTLSRNVPVGWHLFQGRHLDGNKSHISFVWGKFEAAKARLMRDDPIWAEGRIVYHGTVRGARKMKRTMEWLAPMFDWTDMREIHKGRYPGAASQHYGWIFGSIKNGVVYDAAHDATKKVRRV